jgi:hypothetical protein
MLGLDTGGGYGETWFNGGPRPRCVAWMSGTIDVEQATYSIRVVEPGVTHVAVIARKTLLASAEVPPSREGPDLVLSLDELPAPIVKGRVRVSVVDDATGDPIRSGIVVAGVSARDGDFTTMTDEWFDLREDGTADVEVSGGEIVLSANVEGYASPTEVVPLSGGAFEERTLRIARSTRTLNGRARLEGQGSLVQPFVCVYRRHDDDWQPLKLPKETIFDANGRFTIDALPEGALLVVAGDWEHVAATAEIAASGDANAELVLAAGVLVHLKSVARDGRTLGMVRYRIVDERRVPLVDHLALGAFHDADDFPVHLPPGDCTIEACSIGYEPSVTPLHVTEPTSIELALSSRSH